MLDFMGSVRSIDPKRTEEFLLSQEGVVDASVWFERGRLRAHVTLERLVRVDASDLANRCAVEVGEDHTPSDFVVIDAG